MSLLKHPWVWEAGTSAQSQTKLLSSDFQPDPVLGVQATAVKSSFNVEFSLP